MNRPSLSRIRMAPAAFFALAGLSATAAATHPRNSVTLPYSPPRLRVGRREKYPGQSTAYLVGAHRPMSAAEIADHNAALSARRDAARLSRHSSATSASAPCSPRSGLEEAA